MLGSCADGGLSHDVIRSGNQIWKKSYPSGNSTTLKSILDGRIRRCFFEKFGHFYVATVDNVPPWRTDSTRTKTNNTNVKAVNTSEVCRTCNASLWITEILDSVDQTELSEESRGRFHASLRLRKYEKQLLRYTYFSTFDRWFLKL